MKSIKLFVILQMICSVSLGEGYASNAEAEVDAKRAAFEALYKQAGIEKNVTEYAEKQIPDKYKPMIGNIATVARVIVTQKVEYKWRF